MYIAILLENIITIDNKLAIPKNIIYAIDDTPLSQLAVINNYTPTTKELF